MQQILMKTNPAILDSYGTKIRMLSPMTIVEGVFTVTMPLEVLASQGVIFIPVLTRPAIEAGVRLLRWEHTQAGLECMIEGSPNTNFGEGSLLFDIWITEACAYRQVDEIPGYVKTY